MRLEINRGILILALAVCMAFVTCAAQASDVRLIVISTIKDLQDGTASPQPWTIEFFVEFDDPGTVHSVDVQVPGGPVITITADDDWEWCSTVYYADLASLRGVYPEGNYTFAFKDSGGSTIDSVVMNYSGVAEPASGVDYTYPSYDGQEGIDVEPTLTWTISPAAADALAIWLVDVPVDMDIYEDVPAPISTTSLVPGTLESDHSYELEIGAMNVKDATLVEGQPALPSMLTTNGDTFEYALIVEHCNIIAFTTGGSSLFDMIEDYETPPVQDGQFAGFNEPDNYYGIFDDPAVPDNLRVTWGEGGANDAADIRILDEQGPNQFVRVTTDVSAAEQSGFVGILDYPGISDFGQFQLVGDFAGLFDDSKYIGGATISVDARLPQDPGYPVYARFLFVDHDNDEFITQEFPIAVGTWQNISIDSLSLNDLDLLWDSEGDGIWDGDTTFPVSIEVMVHTPATGDIEIDFDNFRFKANCLGRIEGDLNNDCIIDFRDLAILANMWLEDNLQSSQD